MSNEKKENNDGPKRRRPKLYKKDEKDEDVLKKLKEVRQNLQDSLDDGPRAKPTRKRGERKLYKKEEEGVSAPVKPTVSKRKVDKRVSSRRLATVQKRVKERMESTKRLSKGKKVAILIFMIVLSLPLFLITSLAVVGLEFNFSDFGLIYNENKPGTITLSFGARNPSFLPAHLGQFEIELYTEDGQYIGKAYNNDELDIAPYQTEKLFVTLSLDKDKGGAWLADLLSDLKLSMNIGKLTYNGIGMEVDFLPTIELDIQPLIRDAIGGLLDIEELLEGLSLEDLLGSSSGATMSADGSKITVDPYSNAKSSSLLPRMSQFGDDMTANVSFGMSEDINSFDLGLSATINLNDLVSAEDLGGIVLGPIKINNLDVQLMVNNNTLYEDATAIKNDDNWYEHYTTPIAKLFSVKHNPKASDELAIYIADNKNRDSFIGMNLSIFKDNPALLRDNGGVKYHPSQDIDWKAEDDDPNSIESFLQGTGVFSDLGGPAWKKLPGWMFLYNLLGLGKLDCGIKIENADINIFGLDINGVSLPMSVLPPLVVDEGVLSPENLLRAGPDYGVLGMMKHFVKGITETPARGFLGLPEPSAGVPEEQSLDDLLNQVVEMIEFPNINLDDIEENIGESLHLELPISINNTMLNFFMGFDNMTIGIGSEINDITRSFIELKISGNNSETVYFPGMGSFVTVNVELDIKTDFQSQPFATKFLANLIENYTIDGVITAGFDKLRLFQENYTYGRFEIAIPLVLDIESILMGLITELVPGLIGGLIETDDGGNETEQEATFPGSPLGVLMATNPTMNLVSLLGDAPDLMTLAQLAQEEETDEGEDDFISDTLNGLIESLLGGLLGEMDFTLGFEVDYDPGDYAKFTITLDDFLIQDMFITIGLGETLLTVQSKNRDTDEWEDLIGIEVEDYFEIREGVEDDIKLSLIIYENPALCHFIDDFITEFFNKSQTNTVDLQITGYTTVNLSGLYMPNLDILFTLEEMDLGLNGTELRDGLFDMIYDIELDAETGQPKEEDMELLNLWAGSLRDVPIVSQGIDIGSLIQLGSISIEEISETMFNETEQGVGTVKLAVKNTKNLMMSVNIKKFNIDLYKEHPDVSNDDHNKMMRISISDGVNGLQYKVQTDLYINITLYKSDTLENWLNTLISTLQPTGYVNFSVNVDIFGCPIDIKSSYLPFLNLTMLPIDITTLLGVMTPFSGPFLESAGAPQIAQDIDMDSLSENVFKFGLGKLKVGDFQKVGPVDYTNPMMNLGLDLWLEPMFNMSIDSMNLQILDGDLYKALYEYGGLSYADTVEEAAVVEITLNKQAFFNSCIPDSTIHDPLKPYLVNRSNSYYENENSTEWTVDDGVDFVLNQNDLSSVYNRDTGVDVETFNETGFTTDNYLYLEKPTMNNLSLRVNLFNKSHGTWETRYDRKYWKALGSAYFKPRVYEGYPDHRIEYDYDMITGFDEDGRRVKVRSPSAYSPLVGILSKAIALLDEEGIATDPEAIKTLIGGIAVGGYVNITMFSMNLCINLDNPKINSLFEPISGLFLTTTALSLKSYIRDLATPFNDMQAPQSQKLEDLMMSQGIDEIFGDVLDMGSIPLNIYDVVQGISFPGIVDKPHQFFAPQTYAQPLRDHLKFPNNRWVPGFPRTWDGTQKWGPHNVFEFNGEVGETGTAIDFIDEISGAGSVSVVGEHEYNDGIDVGEPALRLYAPDASNFEITDRYYGQERNVGRFDTFIYLENLYFPNNDVEFQFKDGGTVKFEVSLYDIYDYFESSGRPFDFGKWHHLSIEYNGDVARVYWNTDEILNVESTAVGEIDRMTLRSVKTSNVNTEVYLDLVEESQADALYEYNLEPEDVDDYVGGLDDPYFAGTNGWIEKETFLKDVGYEWFKTVVDNWAISQKRMNPYFETNYSSRAPNGNLRYQRGNKIEDPTNWPLRYDKDEYGGRCRTNLLSLHTGILLEFPVTFLSGLLGLWIEDPKLEGGYQPMGYTYINKSTSLMPIDDILSDPWVSSNLDTYLDYMESERSYADIVSYYEQYGQLGADQDEIDEAVLALTECGVNGPYAIDSLGNMASEGWVLNFNIRFFEGQGSKEFFWQMIAGGDFNIHFLAQGLLNVSLFGYEFYNLFLPYDLLALGDPSRLLKEETTPPLLNGTVVEGAPEEEEETEFYPHYLLRQPSLSFGVSLPIDAILDLEGLLDFGNLIGLLLPNIDIGKLLLSGTLSVSPTEIPLSNPVPLALFLTGVDLEIQIGVGEDPDDVPWGTGDVITVLVNNPQVLPLMKLVEGVSHFGDVEDPYDFRYNPYLSWETPHEVALIIEANAPVGGSRLWDLLIDGLIGGNGWIKVTRVDLYCVIPNALSYDFQLLFDLGDISEPMPLAL